MSSYNMIERISAPGSQDSLSREMNSRPYSYGRREIEVADNALWRQALRILRKHWKGAAAFAVLLEVVLALLVFSMQNTYVARAVLDVEPPGADNVNFDRNAGSNPANTPAYLETQTEILNSDGLALGVIDQLHLDRNPMFLKQTLMERAISRAMSLFASAGKSGPQKDTERLLGIFHGNMSVGEVRDSQLVEVRYQSYDSKLAAQIVNAMIDQYLDRTYRSRYDATMRAAQSISPKLNDLQSSVKKSSDALLAFQKSHEGAELESAAPLQNDGTSGIANPATGNPVATRVAELNQQLTAAMAERLQQEAYLKQIKSGQIDTLPQMKDSALIQGLTSRLVDVRAQLAQALAVYGSNEPQVRKLELESEEVGKQLDTERARIATQVESAYNSAVNREHLIQNTLSGMKGELQRTNADVVQYDALKREADADANLYTTLSSRTKELALTGSISASNIRVVDDARMPLSPDGPHRVRILAVGALFGIFGGVVLAFAAEQMTDTISSADDLRRWSGIPAIALVPRICLNAGSGKPARAIAKPSMAAIRLSGLKFLTENPHSPEAEAIRNLETAIRIPNPLNGKPLQTVLITSPLPSEGKTTVATNLALALARHGKTCLVDADIRHPSITPCFGLSLRPGVRDLLANPELSLDEVLKPKPEIPNLTVLGAGNRMPNSLDSITSGRMANLLAELRKRFEYIVLDSPPIIPFSEARWLSTLSDGSIVIARCQSTTRGAVMFSLEILADLKSNVLGVVLNGVDLQAEYYSYGMKDYAAYAAK